MKLSDNSTIFDAERETCMLCGKQFNLITELHSHEASIKNSTVKADYGKYKIIEINTPSKDYQSVLEYKVKHIADILSHELDTSLMFYISPKVEMLINGKHEVSRYHSPATVLTKAEIIEEEVKTHCNIIINKIEKQIGSTREIENIKSIDIMISKS